MSVDFYHHICNTCLSVPCKKGGKLLKHPTCSSCKLVSYCCRPHQKTDWKKHKRFCFEVRTLIQKRKGFSLFSSLELHTPKYEYLFNYQTNLIQTLENELKRSLTICERSMIYFPDICGMCLKPNGSECVACEKCNVQFYCCAEDRRTHSDVHRKDCDALKLCFSVFIFLGTSKTLPSKLKHKQLPLANDFPISLKEYFSKYITTEDTIFYDKIIFSDILSYMLTLIYSIREHRDLVSKNNLKIHIIGASHIDSYMLTILDVFFFWMKSIKSLEMVFIGPDCPSPDEEMIESTVNAHAGVELKISFQSGVLYHDFARAYGTHPDIVVAFNCGFHEFKGLRCDTWKDTIDYILTLNEIVLLTTSYTKREAKDDSEFFLRDDKVTPIKLCEVNHYSSLNPHRNPESSESAVFYFNRFLSIFSIK